MALCLRSWFELRVDLHATDLPWHAVQERAFVHNNLQDVGCFPRHVRTILVITASLAAKQLGRPERAVRAGEFHYDQYISSADRSDLANRLIDSGHPRTVRRSSMSYSVLLAVISLDSILNVVR